LRIAGVASAALDGPLRTARALHSAIVSTRLELLSDGAQVQEIDAAELVVVPQIESLATLQLVFLALSLDRPVLARRTEALAALAGAVGPGWLHLSDGPITAEAVDRAYTSLRQERTERPCLDGRDLVTTQGAYAAVFRDAASRGV
jgi:beta-1,4-mannosyltransferase